MAKQVLPTNFMDDILNESMNGKRRWIITQNDDGTYTFEDATTYDQLVNTFGQAQVNEMNKAINESVDQARVIDDYKTLAAVNQNDAAACLLSRSLPPTWRGGSGTLRHPRNTVFLASCN